ncbi:MAG: hypothetical protein ABSF44_07950 [Candidatus Bathyarchaeia archaeon]
MSGERVIHAGSFFLLLVGLTALSAWLIYTNVHNNMVLAIGGIALSWGIILMALYVVFKMLDWNWWG